MATLKELYETESKELSKNPSRVSQLLDGIKGYKPTSPGLDRSQLAAWFSITNTLLNLDETVTKVISAMTFDQFQNFSRTVPFSAYGDRAQVVSLWPVCSKKTLKLGLALVLACTIHARSQKRHLLSFRRGSFPIWIFFEWKPELQKRDGQLCPDEFFKGKRLLLLENSQNCSVLRRGQIQVSALRTVWRIHLLPIA